MFFLTYLRRELRNRTRQAVFIALGLALGVGLVVTVMGASAGVRNAQAKVLASLYGIGTDLTVTMSPAPPSASGGQRITVSPSGGQDCVDGKCDKVGPGSVIDQLGSFNNGTVSAAGIAKIARLRDVKDAVGGLLLTDNRITIPSANAQTLPQPSSVGVDGVDIAHPGYGPLASARLTKGRDFTSTDENSDVALVDANYAIAHGLTINDTVTLAGTKFTIIGILSQDEATSPPGVYIPFARAQALGVNPATGDPLKNQATTIYVTAASSADIALVQREIQRAMPKATVSSSANLASQITGSLASTAKLANDLGRWLAILVLIAAFALASLLTSAAVSRRVREFGTLKALGWRGSRIVGQVLGESVTTGIIGGLAGVGVGFAGVAIIAAVAPKLTASVPVAGSTGAPQTQTAGPGGQLSSIQSAAHATVSVPMSANVTLTAILLAVLLAVAGGLLAGSLGGWRAARLRPVTALSKVG
jgi:putative ABC transport system permease protein